jgi:Glycosyl transferase family 2
MSSPARPRPLIALCVPTHDGRGATLAELLAGAIAQAAALPDGLVEICVSDNASRDGTQELLAELARKSPCRIAYHRHEHDRGLTRNLVASVELAGADYCWLLGSDDLLADGALARAAELIERLPRATGYAVGAVHVDEHDPRLRSRALPRSFHPAGEQARIVEGLDRIYEECGNSWCALSWTIVDRRAWLRAASAELERALAHPTFPQVVLLAAMAAKRPCWGWLAEPLVRQRNATTFLFERSAASLADRWAVIIDAVARAWGAVLDGRGRARWRRRMRRLLEVWGGAQDIRATKLYETPSWRAQLRLARACARAYWPARDYWRAVLPASLAPVWLTRRRYPLTGEGHDGARRLRPHVVLAGDLPSCMRREAVAHVRLQVRNAGTHATATDGARALTIAQRWSQGGGSPLTAEELGINELAGHPSHVGRRLAPGAAAVTEVALYAPRAAGSYRLELAPHQHGHGWLADGALSACVEVVG